jgi:CPA2 family monovalent cation:H+ antiporter-2
MKVDILVFLDNIGLIVGVFVAVVILKSIVMYGLLRISSTHSTSLKTALALSQVGEFSFVIFALASLGGLLESDLSQLLVLIVIFSMMITPFFISHIGDIVRFFNVKVEAVEDMQALATRKGHVIVCGYSVVGKFVARHLDELDAPYVVIDNSNKHVQEALADGIEAYLGDATKSSILNAIHVENASSVIVTLDNPNKKRLICESVLKYSKDVNLIVKVVSLEEKEKLKDLNINVMVDGKLEVARVLVERMITCQLKYK